MYMLVFAMKGELLGLTFYWDLHGCFLTAQEYQLLFTGFETMNMVSVPRKKM